MDTRAFAAFNHSMSETKKGRGCFFYGCLTLVIVVIVVIIGLFFAGRLFYKKAFSMLTSPAPVAVQPVRLSTRDGDQAVKRLEDFTRLLQQKKADAPLEISSDELDYIVRNSRQGGQIREAIHLILTNDQIHAEMSMPLSVLKPEWNGRYLNGEANVSVSLQGGALVINPTSIEVNGTKLPEQMVSQFFAQALRWPQTPNQQGSELTTNLSRIEIKNDKLILHPK